VCACLGDLGQAADIVSIAVYPPALHLTFSTRQSALSVQATSSDGITTDVTAEANTVLLTTTSFVGWSHSFPSGRWRHTDDRGITAVGGDCPITVRQAKRIVDQFSSLIVMPVFHAGLVASTDRSCAAMAGFASTESVSDLISDADTHESPRTTWADDHRSMARSTLLRKTTSAAHRGTMKSRRKLMHDPLLLDEQ